MMLSDMKHGIQNIKKAREMRLSGASLSEISRELNIPVSTLSLWFKDITLNLEQKEKLKSRVKPRIVRGRMNSLISLKSRRIFKEKTIYENSEKDFPILAKDPFFILGLSLYWSHGTKKGSFQFTSSNPLMISVIKKWMEKYLKIDNSLVKVRQYSSYTRLYVGGVNILRRVIAWQKLLIQYYGKVVE
jgi:hypothetical protein